MFLLELQVFFINHVNTINHALDQFDLRISQTMLVRNVICNTSLATRFTTGSTGLETHAVASGLQSINGVLGPSGEVDVDGCTHTSSQVGWARVDITEFGGDLEVLARFSLDGISDSLDTPGETLENTLDITTLLHGDDTELILLIDPDQESLGGIVEDTTALGPVTLHTGNLQVGVT